MLSKQLGGKSFEDVVSPQSGDIFSKVLPLLSGGKLEPDVIFKMLAHNNPKLSGILQFMPLLSKGFKSEEKKSVKKNYNYVKISDYHKNN